MDKKLKIALDVDDVICQFTPHAHDFYGKEMEKCDYWCEKTMDARLGKLWFTNGIAPDREFWKTIPPLSDPKDITFDFDYYISAFPEEMYNERVEWLKEHGFPDKPLIVSFFKLEKCIELGVDILVDDKPATILKLQNSPVRGIHFVPSYAGFEPVGEYITNLNQLNKYI